MSAAASDRNLLFGILALQMDFLDRGVLITTLQVSPHGLALQNEIGLSLMASMPVIVWQRRALGQRLTCSQKLVQRIW